MVRPIRAALLAWPLLLGMCFALLAVLVFVDSAWADELAAATGAADQEVAKATQPDRVKDAEPVPSK